LNQPVDTLTNITDAEPSDHKSTPGTPLGAADTRSIETGEIDIHNVYRVLQDADPEHRCRKVLLQNAAFEEIEVGSHGTRLDRCWLRIMPWGVAAGFGDLVPFDPDPESLAVVALADKRLGGLLTNHLYHTSFGELEDFGCKIVADRIRGAIETAETGTTAGQEQPLVHHWTVTITGRLASSDDPAHRPHIDPPALMVDHPHPVDPVDPEIWSWNFTQDGDVDITFCSDTDSEDFPYMDHMLGGFLSWMRWMSEKELLRDASEALEDATAQPDDGNAAGGC